MAPNGNLRIVAFFPPNPPITNGIKLRYKFYVANNGGHQVAQTKIKVIFGTTRMFGPSGHTYWLESNNYTSRWQYQDSTFSNSGLIGNEIFDESSIRVCIPDYVGQGKTGAKTESPTLFPKQTYRIDYTGPWKIDIMSQINMNHKLGIIEIDRGDLISDKKGWRKTDLDSTVYRQWNAHVTIDSVTYDMCFALPNDYAQYLWPEELLSLTTEFFTYPGKFQVYYWDLEVQGDEPGAQWQAINRWKLDRLEPLNVSPPYYGARIVNPNGMSVNQRVIEISNVGQSKDYFRLNDVFSL